MSEIRGHAYITRLEYADNRRNHCVKATGFHLDLGQGVVFTGAEDNPDQAIRFNQEEMERILHDQVPPEKLQMLAVVDKNTGGLLLTDMTMENSFGLNSEVPPGRRQLTADYGRLSFAALWEETQVEVSNRLSKLQEQRLRLG